MGKFLLRRNSNIVLGPIKEHLWESQAVFNPSVVRENETVHMLYRAVEGDNFSTIGYAKLDRLGNVIFRCPEPVITRTLDVEKHGCEDPRIVPFEEMNYIFYTAFDGANPQKGENVRIILAETSDFITFKKIGLVGPDAQDKDAMIFPEKINGKIAFLHRIQPTIQLAYFDDINDLISPKKDYWPKHLKNIDDHTLLRREYNWESIKIGAGPPPIRTEAGWLLVYHGVDKKYTYRTGVALLDEENPLKIVARLPYPILEPEREYEKIGDVNMVVFPQGMVLFDDDLQIYYGGADKVVGLATGNLSQLIEELWKHRTK